MTIHKTKRSDAITRSQDEIDKYLNSDNDCTSQPALFDRHYLSLYSSHSTPEVEEELRTPEKLRRIIADMKLCNNPHDRYLVEQYPSRFEMGNPLQLNKPTLKQLQTYLVNQYGKASDEAKSFNFKVQINKVLTLFAKEFAETIRVDLKSENSRYKGSIYKLLVLNYKLGLINKKWADLIKPQPIALDEKVLPSTLDNYLALNTTNKKQSIKNSAVIEAYLTELSSPTPGNTIQQSEFLKILPFALKILEEDVKLNTIELSTDVSRGAKNFKSQLNTYKKKLDTIPARNYSNAHHEVLDHLGIQAQYNLQRNQCIGRYKVLKNLEVSKQFQNAILALLKNRYGFFDIDNPVNEEENELALIVGRILDDNGDAKMSPTALNVAKIIAKAILTLGSLKIKGYTQGHTNPDYSLHAMLTHIANHYKKLETASRVERLGSVPPSTLYLLNLLRDAVYWGAFNITSHPEQFFALQKEIIKNSLEFMDCLREYDFYAVLVLASNSAPGNCGHEENCICRLTNYFLSHHGGIHHMLTEHLARANSTPSNDPLYKYEAELRKLTQKNEDS
ncbi:hypothetical protein L1D55_05940 [Vibrio sp. Isolate22]|uniref:hypothetical protein n=1 Tax=Vibrio sp. Isolate22 TaxID=2908532 RepID=UPI001EFDD3B9|nr:hypothetical protein [Vibrio sp. Isolate22]MCG9691300.1 hypothetical protein [Vibrio sp. Isolate22]